MPKPASLLTTLPATITLELLGKPKPWSTNEDRNKNPFDRAQVIALWKESANLTLRQWRNHNRYFLTFPPAVIQLEIAFPTKHHTRDPHNYCGTVLKAVVDGFVKSGAWPDDGPTWIGHRESTLLNGVDSPHLVHISFLDPETARR